MKGTRRYKSCHMRWYFLKGTIPVTTFVSFSKSVRCCSHWLYHLSNWTLLLNVVLIELVCEFPVFAFYLLDVI